MVTDAQRAEHAARLRGLLYLACPDAPATAITATAEAIAENAEETPFLQAIQLRSTKPPLDELNLRGADLRGAGLANADLNGADLRGTDLANADLRGADLNGAHLNGADLRGADLNGARLTTAHLNGAHLTDAQLYRAILYRAILNGTDLTRADLTDADLTDADLKGARLTGVVNMHLPVGATWDSRTRWPADLVSVVIEWSDEVSPGVYRVRGGQRPDRSTVRV
ncbi:pentapeptide repeat-containing protein [Streptomyces mirabilis]|uniref:pentapeptide repeat-containing protein n=1 Tax=Streptomyces mirabilis TaxID=68239 RepID=UPI00331821DA